jgi:hypothetical protein
MDKAVKTWRRPLATCAVLVAVPCATGLAACGSQSERRASAAPTASRAPATSPAPPPVAVKPKARAQHAHLTRPERRQARRLLKRLRKDTGKAPRSVVTDSGMIP